jgi:hypothetical protein
MKLKFESLIIWQKAMNFGEVIYTKNSLPGVGDSSFRPAVQDYIQNDRQFFRGGEQFTFH